MARKKKKTEVKEVSVAPEAESSAAQAPSAPESAEVAPAPAPEPLEEQKLDLQDAARRFVIGYKEHWYPSMAKFASSHGLPSHATASECRRILALWGAKLN